MKEDDLEVGEIYSISVLDHMEADHDTLDEAMAQGPCFINMVGTYLGQTEHYHVFQYEYIVIGQDEPELSAFYVIPGTITDLKHYKAKK